jgi:hypothetical protein
MRIRGDGRVGIGVTAPGAELEIARGTAPNGSLQINGTTYASHFNFGSAEDTYIRGGKDGGKVIINDYGTFGNVGIGTADPAEKLDVNGNVNITGSLKIGYVRTWTDPVNVAPLTTQLVDCNCPAGTLAIGGGYFVSYISGIVYNNYPVTDSSWRVIVYNNSISSSISVAAYVICARLAN